MERTFTDGGTNVDHVARSFIKLKRLLVERGVDMPLVDGCSGTHQLRLLGIKHGVLRATETVEERDVLISEKEDEGDEGEEEEPLAVAGSTRQVPPRSEESPYGKGAREVRRSCSRVSCSCSGRRPVSPRGKHPAGVRPGGSRQL